MRTLPLTLLALACATAAHAAPKPMTAAQFQAVQSKRLMRLDGDGDGKISLAEWKAAPRGPNAAGDPAKRFAALDRDHSGLVEPAELNAQLGRQFARRDSNHDGQLAPAERLAKRRATPPS